MKRLTLLSGGEKSMTAIAFLFAVFLARPCPFYILDEVEAALDDFNIGRFLDLLRAHADRAQFIVVTHQKRTMEAADTLYGVSMGDDGVSKVVSRRLPREADESDARRRRRVGLAVERRGKDPGGRRLPLRDVPLDRSQLMPKVARRLLVAAVVVVVGALAVASVVSAATTVNLRTSKTKLAFNHKTLTAKHGKVTLVMANPSRPAACHRGRGPWHRQGRQDGRQGRDLPRRPSRSRRARTPSTARSTATRPPG